MLARLHSPIIEAISLSSENFVVEEISKDGKVLRRGKEVKRKKGTGKYLHAVIEKKDWETVSLLKELARRLKISYKRISFAGTKDKNAATTQEISILGIRGEELEKVKIKDMKILGWWYEKNPIKIGELLGNRFTIFWRFPEKLVAFFRKNMFPNYYGQQRFGTTRVNTAKIGYLIIKNRFREAVDEYLLSTEGETNPLSIDARERLKEEQNYQKALEYFPKHLRFERILLSHLAKNNRDYVNALRKLPRQTLLLFVHAFQSYLFNLHLSERIKKKLFSPMEGEQLRGINKFGFPDEDTEGNEWLLGKVIGYNTKENELNEIENELLEKYYITTRDFKIKSLPEISSKGTKRFLFTPAVDVEVEKTRISFSLQRGSYATAIIREMCKKEMFPEIKIEPIY